MNQPPNNPYQPSQHNFQQQGYPLNYQFQTEYYNEPDPRIQFAPPIEVLIAQSPYSQLPSQGYTLSSSHGQNFPYQNNPYSNYQYQNHPSVPGCNIFQNNNYYPPQQQPLYSPGNFANTTTSHSKTPTTATNNFPTNNAKFPVVHTNPTKSLKKGTYFTKPIENEMVLRSEMIGEIGSGQHEFDDYFDKHVDKFFTPEIHQIVFFHDDYNLIGLQTTYRDPWGTMIEKETYHGDLHLSKNICGYYTKTALKLEYDEYITELYIDAQDRITFIKLVTNNGQVLELGRQTEGTYLNNLAVPSTRVMGFGGSYDIYLRSIYLYYN